jgi:probable HAF family extracellular repeat protein
MGPVAVAFRAFAFSSLALINSTLAQSITNLGSIPGYPTFSSISGISSDGSVVTGTVSNGTTTRAFRWTSSGGIVDLGLSGSATSAIATGLSRDGLTVAATMSPFPPSSQNHGFRRTGSSWQDIGVFYVGGDRTDANGVSGDATTLFGQTRVPGGEMRAYTWTNSGGFTLLPSLPTGFNSVASAASNNALFLSGGSTVGGVQRAVRWGPGGVKDLTAALPSIAGGYSNGVTVSDDGATVMIVTLLGASTPGPIYRWQDIGTVGTMTAIPPMFGFPRAYANQLVTDGTAFVGNCSFVAGSSAAALWSNDIGWFHLANWLTGALGVNLTGWQLTNAYVISADGTAIAGTGFFNGQSAGYLIRDFPCLHKPQVYTDPVDTSICAGSTFTLTAAATGTFVGNVTYSWNLDAVPVNNGTQPSGAIITGAGTPTLVVSNATPAEAGLYVGVLVNRCGVTTTAGAQVSVLGQPAITSLPAPQSTCNGSTASFAVGTVNATSISWELFDPITSAYVALSDGPYSGFFGRSFTVSNATTSTLTLSNVQFGLLGPIQVRCLVANPCRTLRPTPALTLSPDSPPTVTLLSPDKVDCYPSYANFTALGSGPYPLTYQWQKFDPVAFSWYNLPLSGPFIEATTSFSAIYSLTQNPTFSYSIDNIGDHPPAAQFRCIISNGCGSTITNVITHSWRNCPYTCPADFDGSGGTPDNSDVDAFWAAWLDGDECADVDCSGGTPDNNDVQVFYDLWLAGGCDVPCPECP